MGVVNESFTSPAIGVPPVAVAYHRYSPALPPEAVSATVPASHRLAPVVVGVEGIGLIVAVTATRLLSQGPIPIDTKYVVVLASDGVVYVSFTSPVMGVSLVHF